jgi:3',5'-cyclic AMP phosphodiesterase CpdA
MVKDMKDFSPDHIVVTGDITNIATPAEFEASRRWLESLGDAACVTVIPGNHDACVAVPWDKSLAHWMPFMTDDAAQLGSHGDFPFIRRRGDVAFIGLTSAVPMPITGTPAAGRLGGEQLGRLKVLLDKLGHDGLFRIVLIHHAPHEGLWIRKALLDQAEFAEVLKKAGAELVLHGHLHQSDFVELASPEGTIPVFGVPSASALPIKGRPPARYNIYRLSGKPGDWRLGVEVREILPDATGLRRESSFDLELKRGGLRLAKAS